LGAKRLGIVHLKSPQAREINEYIKLKYENERIPEQKQRQLRWAAARIETVAEASLRKRLSTYDNPFGVNA
jgi:hypothetical protein